METTVKVLETMRSAGKPVSAGEVATLSGLDRKEVDKASAQLKKDGVIVAPVRCKWQPAEKKLISRRQERRPLVVSSSVIIIFVKWIFSELSCKILLRLSCLNNLYFSRLRKGREFDGGFSFVC